jgi:hypothetical protein
MEVWRLVGNEKAAAKAGELRFTIQFINANRRKFCRIMNIEPTYFYYPYLENGQKLAEYASREMPPKVGEIITIQGQCVSQCFEVLDLSCTTLSLFEIVVLKVVPVSS